jgi:ADP-heptose:LPS heptosyltransferase
MKKVLAIKQRRLGDTALWTASLEALREICSSVDIAYPSSYSALFDSDPRFGKQYLLSDDLSSQIRTLKEIRESNYDAVLSFHSNTRTAYLTRFSKSSIKLIHRHSRTPHYNSFSKPIPNLGVPMSAIERDLNVVRGLGWSGKSPKTRLILNQEAKIIGDRVLSPHLNGSKKKKIALSVNASRLSKQWPLENFISLAQLLAEEAQVFLFYDVAPKSMLWKKTIETTTAIQTPDLKSLLGCLNLMDGFMGADSGVKHIAAALNIPTVTVFGPESVGEWHGYDPVQHRAIQVSVQCRNQNPENPDFSWCGEEICPLGSHACLTTISPEQVLKEIKSVIL